MSTPMKGPETHPEAVEKEDGELKMKVADRGVISSRTDAFLVDKMSNDDGRRTSVKKPVNLDADDMRRS